MDRLAPYGVSLQEALPTLESDSVVLRLLQSQTPWCLAHCRIRHHVVAHCRIRLHGVLPTPESDSIMSNPLRGQESDLHGALPTAESDSIVSKQNKTKTKQIQN